MNENNITKLSVFDFDGTLVDTGTPETHKPIWKEKTGTEYPHKGWWGRKESLDMSVFDFQAKPDVVSAYNQESSNGETMVIMLTGRRPKLGNEVKAILDSKNLSFDLYLYNYGSDTLSNKIEQVNRILGDVPSIVDLEMWDDRNEHIPKFEQWGKELVNSGRLNSFNMNHVHNPQWTK